MQKANLACGKTA